MHSGITVAINNLTWDSRRKAFPVSPGLKNSLRITISPEAMPGNGVFSLRLTKVLPDGTKSIQVARISKKQSSCLLDLGPFTAPAEYDFEYGEVYRRGYRFELSLTETISGRKIKHYEFYQGLSLGDKYEYLYPGRCAKVRMENPDHGKDWAYRAHARKKGASTTRGMMPLLLMKLGKSVLLDQDQLCVETKLSEYNDLVKFEAELSIKSCDCQAFVCKTLRLSLTKAWQSRSIDPADWPEGAYRIDLFPVIDNKVVPEGPCLFYRRRGKDAGKVLISPFSSLTLERDETRKELEVCDLDAIIDSAIDPAYFELREINGHKAVVGKGGGGDCFVSLNPGLKGMYAVFVTPLGEAISSTGTCTHSVPALCHIRFSGEERVYVPAIMMFPETFVACKDLTDKRILLLSSLPAGKGVAKLRFVPVKKDSAEEVLEKRIKAHRTLFATADWIVFFIGDANCLDKPSDYQTITDSHEELGVMDIGWALGRSTLEYHSHLPNTTRFPRDEADEKDAKYSSELRKNWHSPILAVNRQCPLRTVLELSKKSKFRIWGQLAMQRHYSLDCEQRQSCSRFYSGNPQWHDYEWGSDKPTEGVLCYFFPEVRKERIDILMEAASLGVYGLKLDCNRQTPMLRYHPEMVKAFEKETGFKLTRMNPADQKDPVWDRWIRWRADFFTMLLRGLKTKLSKIENTCKRKIPVAVRLPSAGLYMNLAQGLDIEIWCKEDLVDEIQLHPLERSAGIQPHDVRAYVGLGHRHGICVRGGANSNTYFWNPVAFFKRVEGLYKAGVDGIELYQTDNWAVGYTERWSVPLLGDREDLKKFMEQTNIQACFPVLADNALAGTDNHSFGRNLSVMDGFGKGSMYAQIGGKREHVYHL